MTPPNRTVRLIALLLSLALLTAAIVYGVSQGEPLADAWHALQAPSATMITLLLGSILLQIILSGLFFSLLYARYGRVGGLEMQAVVAAASLVNYLPLRPGLFGRIAYHKAVNQITIADSTRVTVRSIIFSVLVGCWAILAVILTRHTTIAIWSWLILPIPALLISAAVWRTAVKELLAIGIRLIEAVLWGARYYAVFALIDVPITFDTAIALGCVSSIANMVPLISNGLGVREWAIGLVTPLIAASVVTPETGTAIAAELVNRIAELIIIAAAGSLALLYLSSRRADAASV